MSERVKAEIIPSESERITIPTHDWCKPTTWYFDSEYIEVDISTNNTDTTCQTYDIGYKNIIDCFNLPGVEVWMRIKQPQVITEHNGIYYFEEVVVNGTKLSKDQYSIDYANGTITFNASQEGNTIIFKGYHARTSKILITPPSDKIYKLRAIEWQADNQLNFNTPFKFKLIDTTTGETKVEFTYKNIVDFLTFSNKGYMLTIGTTDIIVCPWEFDIGCWVLEPGKAFEMYLIGDTPFSGEFCTGMFCFIIEEA